MWSALAIATAVLATALPRAAADMPGTVYVNNMCEHEAITSGEGACMWTGDASGFMGCDDCDGKCVVRSNSSDISIGAQARIMQDSLCTSLAMMIHLFAGSGDASADDRPKECPTEQDIKAVYPTIEQMAKASASAGDEDQMVASLMVHLESEGSLIKFFADKCESGTIALDTAGASVSLKTCVNKGGATMAALKNSKAMEAACQLSDAMARGDLKCLTTGSFMHVSADCLAALAATVKADAALAAELSASYKAVHNECAKLTTQAACTGAELATEQAALKEAETKASESATAMPSGALAARAAAAVVVGVALLAAALV